MDSTRPVEATCPECRGPLSEVTEGDGHPKLLEFKCLVGHTYSPRALLEAHSETQERTLWSAVVVLEESARMVQAIESEFKPEIVERLRQQVATKMEQASQIRRILEQLEPFRTGPID